MEALLQAMPGSPGRHIAAHIVVQHPRNDDQGPTGVSVRQVALDAVAVLRISRRPQEVHAHRLSRAPV
jgi:hypothetical protein